MMKMLKFLRNISYGYKEIYSFKSKKSSASIDSSAMRTEDLHKVNIERKKLDFDNSAVILFCYIFF